MVIKTQRMHYRPKKFPKLHRGKLFLLSLILILHQSVSLLAQTGTDNELAQRLERHVTFLSSDSLDGRGLGTEGTLLAQKYIAEKFRMAGLQPYGKDYFQSFTMRIGQAMVPGTNVIGYIPGSDTNLGNEYIVIGAHYDHLGYRLKNGEKVIYHGADDNASGTAALLELAAYFSSNPQIVKRGIIFIAFDAEESGLLGSAKFISENGRFKKDDIKAMFSLDMIGMYSANKGLSLKGIGSLNDGENLAKTIASSQNIILKNISADIEAQSDTWNFGEDGIPAIHAFTGTKSPYHKPEDTFDLLDYKGMEKVTIFIQTLITDMSVMPELTPSHRFARLQKPFAVRFNSGILVSAGISRNRYPDEFYTAKGIFAFNTGVFFQMHIGQRLTIEPEILYDYNGSKSSDGKFSRQSVTIPLDIQFNIISEMGGLARVYPFAGGYFRYSFDGKNGDEELDFENQYKDQEFGCDLGLGMDFKRVHLAYTWRRGLTNIAQANGTRMFNSGQFLTLGFKF
jgi:hypothetical protein